MIRIRLRDATEAVFEGRRWRSSDARTERLLNSMVAPWGAFPGETAGEHELREATVAAKVLGAEILSPQAARVDPSELASANEAPTGVLRTSGVGTSRRR